ncbi:FAD-dependent monooxygenase [Solirubrobacter ginsenosidimutans]|uniref:FAD-dependent monooxygenase n=1 Tax=Solirubrobacter ginsenosidimutans TaxID=490573 RepID=A0A9X3S0B5_9ACTN|nr:NAD(P)/FAD-dependent oxidoreductase [Solirubrobacter ginsenosidimutans]MDA0159061.1 FAD-dependent monooxygenase [Solirubrobacter ginsenosidimutans]
MEKPLHVLIAGGGLSGLCLAQGLRKSGHTVEVFERDPDHRRRTGYMLHMNAFGGEGLRTCLPDDLYELYLETSRATPTRRESIVLDSRLNELSAQPHLGPPNDGPRPHTGVHRRTLRQILLARIEDAVQLGSPAASYEELEDSVRLVLADGSTAEGDVLVGADGIRSAIRAQRLPAAQVIEATVDGIGVYGRSPLPPDVIADLPELLLQGVIIVTDMRGNRLLLGPFQPRRTIADAPADLAPDVELDAVEPYIMVSCSLMPGTVVPPAREWTAETAPMLRTSMQQVVGDWHPALRGIVERIDLESMFSIPFGRLDPPDPWTPSRVTLIGDAAHAMLPTLGMGANLSLRDAGALCRRLEAFGRGEQDLLGAIGAYEDEMRNIVYPFMRMTAEHDKHFGGGALQRDRQPAGA